MYVKTEAVAIIVHTASIKTSSFSIRSCLSSAKPMGLSYLAAAPMNSSLPHLYYVFLAREDQSAFFFSLKREMQAEKKLTEGQRPL